MLYRAPICPSATFERVHRTRTVPVRVRTVPVDLVFFDSEHQGTATIAIYTHLTVANRDGGSGIATHRDYHQSARLGIDYYYECDRMILHRMLMTMTMTT